jgi:hypothetical protein
MIYKIRDTLFQTWKSGVIEDRYAYSFKFYIQCCEASKLDLKLIKMNLVLTP